MKTIYTAILLLSFHAMRCQSNAVPNFTTSSPEVYAFEKNISIPVSYHTGLPSIQVPIYTINSGNINMPIALSYHAQGIRVEEVATRYGLGWNLQGGGAVTREVRDRPDEIYYFSNPYKFVGMTENPQRLAAFHQDYVYDVNELLDINPDIFSFSVAGYSGKFFFDQATRKIILQSFDDLTVTELDTGNTSGIIEGFLITDTKGTKYYFGRSADGLTNEREASESISTSFYQFFGEDSGTPNYTPPGMYTGSVSGGDYTAKWSLVEIADVLGNRAVFSYGSERLHYTKRIYDGYLNPRMLGPGTGKKRRVSMKGIATNTTRFLREISFPQGKIEFLPCAAPRQDIENNPATSPLSAYATERINVTDRSGALISSHKLEYEYVESTDVSNVLFIYPSAPEKRLFLKRVRQSALDDSGEKWLPPHEFTYNDMKLPSRFSNSIDWWGFYNGRQNGNTYDPFSMQPTMDFLVSYHLNGGREVGPEFSQAGLLKKITYPAGGSSEYEYEQNSVAMPRFMIETVNFFRNPTLPKAFNFVDNSTTDNTLGQVYISENFDIRAPQLSSSQNAQVYVHGHNFSSPGLAGGTPHPNPQFGTELPIQSDTDRPFSLSLVCNYSLDPWSECGNPIALNFPGFNFLANIKSGNYHLRAQRIKNRTGPFPEFAVGMAWLEESVQPGHEMFVGGSRIRRIVLDDGQGNSMAKRYEYKRLGSNTSSGMLFGFPFYFEQIDGPTGAITFGPPLHTFTNGPTSHAGYSAVTEYIESASGNQKIEYEFTASQNEGRFHKRPFPIQADNGWLRGRPKRTAYYKLKNGTYSKTKEVITAYNYPPFLGLGHTDPAYPPDTFEMEQGYLPKSHVNSMKQYFLSLPKPLEGGGDTNFQIGYQGNYYKFEVTYIAGGIFNTKFTEETDYLDSGAVTKRTDFFYESPYHTQLTRKQETTSDNGSVLETRYHYAPDTGEAGLAAQNRVSEPIMTESFRNSELLASSRTLFKDWDPGTGKMILPDIVQSSKGSGVLETRVRYNAVDPSNGKPLEVQQEDGMKTCYVWGYGKSLPVARIENIAYAAIPANLVDAVQAASDASPYSEQAMLQALDALRAHPSLSGAMASTFTHRPLVGMVSATDPKGDRTTYEYDAFNRLKAVRDSSGKLLTENEYHYKNQ